LHKHEVLLLVQRRLRMAEVRVSQVVDKLPAAAVEAARRCTLLQRMRRT
jgi:hypothetical protein